MPHEGPHARMCNIKHLQSKHLHRESAERCGVEEAYCTKAAQYQVMCQHKSGRHQLIRPPSSLRFLRGLLLAADCSTRLSGATPFTPKCHYRTTAMSGVPATLTFPSQPLHPDVPPIVPPILIVPSLPSDPGMLQSCMLNARARWARLGARRHYRSKRRG